VGQAMHFESFSIQKLGASQATHALAVASKLGLSLGQTHLNWIASQFCPVAHFTGKGMGGTDPGAPKTGGVGAGGAPGAGVGPVGAGTVGAGAAPVG
jgi:hypothetical protein